jgi:hypothetical protein
MKAGETGVVATGGALHLSYRCVLALAAITCLLGCAQKITTSSSSISATYDQAGEHPGTATAKGIATVSCADASGSQGSPVDCLILAPGYMGEVGLHKSVTTTGAGTIQLSCSNQGRCTALVVQ